LEDEAVKWEYKVLKIDSVSFWGGLKVEDDSLEKEMNMLGKQGWEMTKVLPIETNESTTAVAVFFKRQMT
ncbi:MAG: DUF4177 domain-containing protein, partial [Planctomycetota bacterium]|jgi:hypothetical protein